MRAIFVLAFLALASAVPVKDDPVEVIAAEKFINECIKKVLIDGLPEANIPTHEPLHFHVNDIKIPLPIPFVDLHLLNMTMEGIPEFELREVTSHPEKNPNGVFFDYNIYWKSMAIKSIWETTLMGKSYHHGEQSMTMNHVTFSGTWNMTNAADMPQTLDTFSINIESKSVDFIVGNAPKYTNPIFNSLGQVINKGLNSPALGKIMSVGLLKKFNKDWMQKGERIDAMLNYCWPKH